MTITLDADVDCPPVDPERPFVEFDAHKFSELADAYRHADGSITYVAYDPSGCDFNPRKEYEHSSVLVQRNTSCIDLDDDREGLGSIYDRWGTLARDRYLARYLSIFREDILHFADWHAGDSYGYGYITREAYDEACTPKGRRMTTAEVLAYLDVDGHRAWARDCFNAEVAEFGNWANGEVYMAVNVTPDKPIVVYGDHGAYVTGWTEHEEACHGFIGYGDNDDVAAQMTGSEIVAVLA